MPGRGTTMKLMLSELHGIPTAPLATVPDTSFSFHKSPQVSLENLAIREEVAL